MWVVDKNAKCLGSSLCREMGTYDPTQSSTSKILDEGFFLAYIDLTYTSGTYYLDDVTIPNGPTLKQFQFANSNITSTDFGILGIGLNTTEEPVFYNVGLAYPNFPLTLKNQGYISKAAYSLYLNDADTTSGTLLFGGIDNAKIDGDLLELPGAFDSRLGIHVDSVTVDGAVHSAATGFVFDSGYSYSALPPNITDAIGKALSGSVYVGDKDYPYKIDCAQPDKNISITFGSDNDQKAITVPYSGFVVPGNGTICNATISYSSDGSNFDNLPTFGDDILRSFYIVYDVEENNISVGQAKYTTDSDISNIQ